MVVPASVDQREAAALATRTTPPIPGLYVFPRLCHWDAAQDTLRGIGDDDLFSGGNRDQVMLFDRSPDADLEADFDPVLDESLFPVYITDLLEHVRVLVQPLVPAKVHEVVFNQNLARQVIINLYQPGQGISPHIDLPGRYADGILGVSLCGGCVMSFRRDGEVGSETAKGRADDVATPSEEVDLEHHTYLPPLSVYLLTGQARWRWSHGIPGRREDIVVDETGRRETILRQTRVSVTFRWMKPGADILGENGEESAPRGDNAQIPSS